MFHIVLRAGLLVLLSSVAAYACPADGDGDGVCDALDNCPAIANANQSDLDGDLIGDKCDAVDAALALTSIQIRNATNAAGDNGAIKVKGDFTVVPPDRFFASGDLSLRLVDAMGFIATHVWPQGHCGMVASGQWLCLAPGVGPTMTFKARSSTSPPTRYRFSIAITRLGLSGSYGGPVTATISQDLDIDRSGSLTACKATPTKLICKP